MRWLFLVLLGVTVCPGCSTDGPPRRFLFAQIIMGVRVDIAAYAESQEKATDAARAAFAAMNELDRILTDYRSDSEAMRLAAAPRGSPVRVSEDLYRLTERSLAMSRASGGAFDITVGPLVQLWRTARHDHTLPAEQSIQDALGRVGSQNVTLGAGPATERTITLSKTGMQLDFGGIGKGYAADRGVAILRARGLPRCLVAVAGDIAAGDPPPGSTGWKIEISPEEKPQTTRPRRYIVVSNCGVSTSGSTEQFVEIGGRRYSHIVDPRSGWALDDQRAEVVATIIAPDATTSDALGKAGCVLSRKEAEAVITTLPGCAAYFTDRDGGNVSVSGPFPEVLTLAP